MVKKFLILWVVFIIFLLLYPQSVSGQSSSKLFLENIIIQGNQKTKNHIILREIDFKAGDSLRISELDSLKTRTENNIFNLSLFLKVHVSFERIQNNNCICIITVKERFYTIPGFYVELADRTFNEWWFLHQHQLSRIDLGFILTQKNCRGQNETFHTYFQAGYSHRLNLIYTVPGLTDKRKTGLDFQFQWLANREFAYSIDSLNRLQYVSASEYLRKRIKSSIFFYYRPKIYTIHQLELSYNLNQIKDTVIRLNPDYLGNSNAKLNFLSFNYSVDLNRSDIQYYPLKGYHLTAVAGFFLSGFNQPFRQFNLNLSFSFYYKLMPRLFAAHQIRGLWCSNAKPGFLFTPSFGYENILVRSFEYYLITGKYGALFKNELKTRAMNKTIRINWLKWAKFNEIPVSIYPKVFFDMGFMRASDYPANYLLNNQIIYGFGSGIDLISYYDIIIRLEAGYNQLGEKHLFIHFRKAI